MNFFSFLPLRKKTMTSVVETQAIVSNDDTTNVKESNEVDVKPTGDVMNIVIPFKPGEENVVRESVEFTRNRFIELVSKDFGKSEAELRAVMPDIVFKEVKKQKTNKKKTKNTTIHNWENADKMECLKDLKLSDLKDILKSNEMKTSGSKQKLIERVWSINHPNEIQATPMGKRGRPKGSTKGNKSKKDNISHEIVEDSDDETSKTAEEQSIEEMLENACEVKMSDGQIMKVVKSKKWVLSTDEDGDLNWEGFLNDDGESFTESEPPKALVELYES